MSDQRDLLSRGEWYQDDSDLRAARQRCARLLDSFHEVAGDDDEGRLNLLTTLLGSVGDGAMVVPRFQCSYGSHIRLGDHAFVNANAFFMDDATISIAANVRIGPGAQLMTALHPVDDHAMRQDGWERALPIVIGENSWLGASVTVGPGVTIGRNAVVGAGSLVLHDVEDHVVVAGTPARMIRRTPAES